MITNNLKSSKNIYNEIIIILLTVVGIIILNSCSEDDEIVDETPPTISNLEVGLNNSKTVHQGGELHIEFDAADNEELSRYEVHIHAEEKSSLAQWEFENTWNFEPGLKNTLVHHHEIMVPQDAALGHYHFHLMLVDASGNSTSVETEIDVIEETSGPGPDIHVSQHPDDEALFQTGATIQISGQVHGEMAVLDEVLIALVDEDDQLSNEEVEHDNSIVLLHTHDFSDPHELEFDASIVVGAAEDNNYPVPNPVSDWNLNECYLLIKVKDVDGNWSYSSHYHIQVTD
jgi:hypothetical protein